MNARRSSWTLPGLLLLATLSAIFVIGCSGATSGTGDGTATTAAETTTDAASATGTVTVDQARQAGVIAKAIEAAPDRMEAILQEHQMTTEGFQSLLYDIAQDPTLTEAYEAGKA